MCNEAVVAYLKILSRHSPGVIEEIRKTSQSGYLVYLSRLKPNTSRIQFRSVTT
jgi:hypothetical protein